MTWNLKEINDGRESYYLWQFPTNVFRTADVMETPRKHIFRVLASVPWNCEEKSPQPLFSSRSLKDSFTMEIQRTECQ